MSSYRRKAFAETTKQTYECQRKAFLRFCLYFGYQPCPVSNATLGRYAAFLARTLKPSSIPGYMNIIRIIHLENSLPNPLEGNWYLSSVTRGINRQKGTTPNRKLPITVDILKLMWSKLNHKDSFQATFWAACVCAFFTFFRKSTLLTKSESSHDCNKDLCRSDLTFTSEGAVITVKHTKTIQCHERLLQVPIPLIQGSVLCPIRALQNMVKLCDSVSPTYALFSYRNKSTVCILTYCKFLSALKSTLKSCGLEPSVFSGHSFRRAGASYSFACGVDPFWIKSQGDWSSNAYERYLYVPMDLRWKLVKLMAQKLEKH